MTVVDLLEVGKKQRRADTLYVSDQGTILDAMKRMAENETSSLVVVNDEEKVVGMLHQKSIIRRIVERGIDAWDGKVSELSVAAKDIIYLKTTDTVENCRAVMALSNRNYLPVLEGCSLLGVVSLTDIAALLYEQEASNDGIAHSAKSDYVTMILPRKGLPTDTQIEQPTMSQDKEKRFILHSAAVSIPHPGKVEAGGEDAYFLGTDDDADINSPVNVTCVGVSDGVGSWFEQNIDPSLYSRALMQASKEAVQNADKRLPFAHPVDVLDAAYQSTLENRIHGSATACIVAIDPEQGELHAVNLGDSGFVIVHDKKSDKELAGMRGTLDGSLHRTVRDREMDLTPAGRRKGAHITYRSPQQLHYFNCPYQLGFAASAQDTSGSPLFESPEHASLLRVPVTEGDLIILATDGLFDNMDEDELLKLVVDEPEVSSLVKNLAQRAQERSLSKDQDSPFARLAKENDILWSGGMPDDITIVACRVMRL